jgi:hypothetical protein
LINLQVKAKIQLQSLRNRSQSGKVPNKLLKNLPEKKEAIQLHPLIRLKTSAWKTQQQERRILSQISLATLKSFQEKILLNKFTQ